MRRLFPCQWLWAVIKLRYCSGVMGDYLFGRDVISGRDGIRLQCRQGHGMKFERCFKEPASPGAAF